MKLKTHKIILIIFKVGQEVVCIHTFKGISKVNYPMDAYYRFPKRNEILTISRITLDSYLIFKELHYADAFASDKFRSLDYNFVEQIIKQVQPKPLIKITKL